MADTVIVVLGTAVGILALIWIGCLSRTVGDMKYFLSHELKRWLRRNVGSCLPEVCEPKCKCRCAPPATPCTCPRGVIAPNFAEFYADMPSDNVGGIAPGAAIQFPTTGTSVGTIRRDVGTLDTYVLPNIGSYRVDFDATIDRQVTIIIPVINTGLTFIAVIAGTSTNNTGITPITGAVASGAGHTGFPPGTASAFHDGDATYTAAQIALVASILAITSLPPGTNPGDLSNLTLGPGVYDTPAGMTLNTGTLTLSGAGLYVFRAGSTLISGSGTHVVLTNGATPENVFWYAGSSATFGTGSTWQGTVIAVTSITATTGAMFNGPLYAQNGAVTLDTNTGITFLGANDSTSLSSSTLGGQLSVNFSVGLAPNTFTPLNAQTLVGIVNQGQLHGNPIIKTTFANSRIQIINPSAINTLLLTPFAGGEFPVTARLLITQEA